MRAYSVVDILVAPSCFSSFASGFAPFLSKHFGRAVYLWQNYVGADAVLQEKPAVVIQEIVGRHLLSVAPYNDMANQH
jgi:hypothetical protein